MPEGLWRQTCPPILKGKPETCRAQLSVPTKKEIRGLSMVPMTKHLGRQWDNSGPGNLTPELSTWDGI